ncbi:MAG TPA: zinc ribbon domain-containing protein [Anaerolineales bacterium]|nr:zinc ribbon domain-containing protein [Anaerolineales bacterium]
MRKWLFLIWAVCLVFPALVQAQGSLRLETMNVHLWSEYDQPSMLVILDFVVAPDTTLPATVGVRIPQETNITAVAVQNGNQYSNTEFSGPDKDGTWQVVNVFVKEYSTYRIEYYQPIDRNGTERSFTYLWSGEYAVNSFRIEIQVPGDSTAVKSKPALPFAPSEQFLSSRATANNLEAGETYQINLQYSRTSDETVFSPPSQVTADESITQNTPGRITLDSLPYILGGVGLLLVLGAGYYFLQSKSVRVPKPRKRYAGKRDVENANVYCHECGTRAHAEDRFCRVCGTKLRTG